MNTIELDEIDSTNAYAKRNLASLADRVVIYTKRQTNGHGQFNRKWVDLGGENLFLTLVLKPSEEFKEAYNGLTLYTAEVLCRVLACYDVAAQIKPPNDVLVNGKKIAGILAETATCGGKCSGIILGIGVNLNAESEDIAKVSDKEITALNIETGAIIEADVFINKLLEEFWIGYCL